MINKVKKVITVEQEDAVSIICDRCKKEFKIDDPSDFEAQEFHCIRLTGGYGSVFGDGTEIHCDLCPHCLKELIGEFCRTTD